MKKKANEAQKPSPENTPSSAVADAPTGQPDYMVSPWPELMIDLRTIRKIEYCPEKDIGCGIVSEAGIRINGELYPDRTRNDFSALKQALAGWHTWAAKGTFA